MTTSIVVTKQPVSTSAITVVTRLEYKKHPRGKPRAWSTPLFACLEDVPSCMIGCFFPICFECLVACKVRESCCIACFYPFSTLLMRSVVRERHNINGTVCEDACIICCCGPCAACQTYREVENIRTGRVIP